MSKWVVDIHGDIEGDYEIIKEYKEPNMGHWIPVSERLPERSVWVLAYCKTKDGYEYQTVLLLAKYNGEWTDCDDFCDDVIAWMPLPEPYKAESDDKNE